MEYSLKNKVFVVTGGANGIGFQIVDQYLEQEAQVAVILDIDEMQGEEAVKILSEKYGDEKVDFIKCDVTLDLDPTLKTIINKYKTVDVLVLNAGCKPSGEPKGMINVLLTSVIEWSVKFSSYLRENKSCGTIIINSSIFGIRTIPHAPVYQTAKFGVIGFTKSFGHVRNFQRTDVRVVALCPGFTVTNMTLPIYDPKLKKHYPDQDLIKFTEVHPWQKAETVGKAAVEIFKKAKSGSVWVIEGNELKEHL